MSTPNQSGKGDAPRPVHGPTYRARFDNISWPSRRANPERIFGHQIQAWSRRGMRILQSAADARPDEFVVPVEIVGTPIDIPDQALVGYCHRCNMPLVTGRTLCRSCDDAYFARWGEERPQS